MSKFFCVQCGKLLQDIEPLEAVTPIYVCGPCLRKREIDLEQRQALPPGGLACSESYGMLDKFEFSKTMPSTTKRRVIRKPILDWE